MTESRLAIFNGPKFNYSNQHQTTVSPPVIEALCAKACTKHNLKMDFRETDNEERLLAWINDDELEFDALVINPGIEFQNPARLTAALNKIAQRKLPITEIHLDNIFNQQSQNLKPLNISKGKTGFISGLNLSSYTLAISTIARSIKSGS